MSREAFEMVARKEFPEIDLSRSKDGDYLAALTRGWYTGWQLARQEMAAYLQENKLRVTPEPAIVRWARSDPFATCAGSVDYSDIVTWGSGVKVGGTA